MNNTQPRVTSHQPTLEQLRDSEQKYYAKKRGDKPQPMSEGTKAYIQKMQSAEQAERDTSMAALMGQLDRRQPKSSFIPYPYTLADAYPLALRIYESQLAAVGRSPEWDSDAEIIFSDLVRYFIGDEGGTYDVHRGIYLFGVFGTGKTMLMKAFQEFTRLIEERLTRADVAFTPRSFRWGYTRDIALEMQRTASMDGLRTYFHGTRLFDDLGHEDEKKIYGNQVSAMTEILLTRYNAWQASGLITHCTSNLPPHQCREVYGDRLGSRIFELFNHVYLDGRDKRMG
jgi:hypothetical protein